MTSDQTHVTFRHVDASPALDAAIRARAQWLTTFHPGLATCRVLVDVPHHDRAHGRTALVRIELSLPGGDVTVTHDPQDPLPLEQVVHDAFDVARRQLEDAARRQRGDVKTPATSAATPR